jgi:uncharacterized protein (TIGR02246 family)
MQANVISKRLCAIAAYCCGFIVAAGQAQEQPAAPSIPAAEKPFYDSAQAFVNAYAKRDARAIGEMFTEDAEMYDEFGEQTVGRDAIVAMFQDVFTSNPEALIHEIQIERIRAVTPNVALEEGYVIGAESSDAPRHRSRYVALHLKGADGKWRINTLKDTPREKLNRREQLEQLAWLLGDWVNEDSDAVVHTSCGWSEDGNYLLRKFRIETRDGRVLNGVQRIGWDESVNKLRSWTFDSEGGFFRGLWTKKDDRWLLTASGVTADGKTASATSVYTRIDAEMVTWQFTSFIVGDEVRNDTEKVTMVKRPPAPLGSN